MMGNRYLYLRLKQRAKVYTLALCFMSYFIMAPYLIRWQEKMESRISFCENMEGEEEEKWELVLLKEAESFPVRIPLREKYQNERQIWHYEDGYGEGRSFGGKRKHEGIDILATKAGRGELEVQSVSDGRIEQIGWLTLGGYRIGVRSVSGLYYYYAHLDSYAEGLKKGQIIHAGQLLGYMGDTGYGCKGTRGKFPVHLHFGVYCNRDCSESINPYYLLQYLEYGMIIDGEKAKLTE